MNCSTKIGAACIVIQVTARADSRARYGPIVSRLIAAMAELSSDETGSRSTPDSGRDSIRDDQGQTWTISEEPAPREHWSGADHDNHAHGYGIGWLVFQHDVTRKRLRLYPATWRTLPEHELRRLCDRARPCP